MMMMMMVGGCGMCSIGRGLYKLAYSWFGHPF